MKLFKIITPLILVDLFAVYLILYGLISKEFLAELGIYFGLPMLIVSLLFDYGFRKWCKDNTSRLWLYESILITVTILICYFFVFK